MRAGCVQRAERHNLDDGCHDAGRRLRRRVGIKEYFTRERVDHRLLRSLDGYHDSDRPPALEAGISRATRPSPLDLNDTDDASRPQCDPVSNQAEMQPSGEKNTPSEEIRTTRAAASA